ncbi:MAG: DUF3617 family protein [Pseudolabrys sp.]
MPRHLAIVVAVFLAAGPAFAIEMPPRKAGLWELKMAFEGRNLPATVLKQCIDPATDKLMNSNYGGAANEACSKQEVTNPGGTMVVDSICTFGETTTTSHASSAVISTKPTPSTSPRRGEGGRALPGQTPGAPTKMSIAATWLGPCADGQRPGDIIMSNGRIMNVLDLPKMGAMPKRP